jgi:putative transposase
MEFVRPANPHYRRRFPVEIISQAVWLHHVFSLSLRDVELILAERGVVVSPETVRRWCKKFGQTFANRLRRRRPRPGGKLHLDEVFIRIQGVQHYLWRAVNQDGVVLDILVQSGRNAKAAKRFEGDGVEEPKRGDHADDRTGRETSFPRQVEQVPPDLR